MNGEIGEISQLLNPLQRVQVPVVNQIQERLSTHLKAWILQQKLNPRKYGLVTACVKDTDCFLAHLGRRVI